MRKNTAQNDNKVAVSIGGALQFAYAKGASDIYLAKRISEVLRGSADNTLGRDLHDSVMRTTLPLSAELRHKTVSALVRKELSSGEVNSAMELGSGFSTRGIELALNLGINYTEVDFSWIVQIKADVMRAVNLNLRTENGAVFVNRGLENNLHIVPGDVLHGTLLEDISSNIEGPVVIITEGLVSHFTIEDAESLCKRIHGILSKNGGAWISSDNIIRSEKAQNELHSTLHFKKNLFSMKSREEFQRFYKVLGFNKVDFHPVYDGSYPITNSIFKSNPSACVDPIERMINGSEDEQNLISIVR